MVWSGPSNEDLRCLYSLASVFVYPSFFEGFGFPPLEAQACGAPVVASNRASLPEILGDSALLVDPWRVGELAEAIRAFLEGPALAEDYCARGAANVKRFPWSATARGVRKVFEQIHAQGSTA